MKTDADSLVAQHGTDRSLSDIIKYENKTLQGHNYYGYSTWTTPSRRALAYFFRHIANDSNDSKRTPDIPLVLIERSKLNGNEQRKSIQIVYNYSLRLVDTWRDSLVYNVPSPWLSHVQRSIIVLR